MRRLGHVAIGPMLVIDEGNAVTSIGGMKHPPALEPNDRTNRFHADRLVASHGGRASPRFHGKGNRCHHVNVDRHQHRPQTRGDVDSHIFHPPNEPTLGVAAPRLPQARTRTCSNIM